MQFSNVLYRKVFYTVENHLSKKFACPVQIESADELGGGCINNAIKIETNLGAFFLKWNNDCETDMFIREAESLVEIKKACTEDLYVPEVYACKKVDATPGFLVQEYVFPGTNDADCQEKLGRGLAIMHKYAGDGFGFEENNYCGATKQNNQWKTNWLEFYRENRLGYLLKLIQKERSISTSELKMFDRFLSKLDRLLPSKSEAVLIHGDLWGGNYMRSTQGPVLIDPAASYSDREMEFGIITMFGGFNSGFFGAYEEENPLPEDWRSRNSIYQLYHILNHYYLFGGAYKSQALSVVRAFL